MSSKVIVAGVGMIPFAKPGASAAYHEMGAEAGRRALSDAGIGFEAIEQAYAGYVYGDSTAGQKAIYQLGMTGIPIVNVNNNCSTGSTALYLARQAVASGRRRLRAGDGLRTDEARRDRRRCSWIGQVRSRISTRWRTP